MKQKSTRKEKLRKKSINSEACTGFYFKKFSPLNFYAQGARLSQARAELSIARGRTLKSEGKNSQKHETTFFYGNLLSVLFKNFFDHIWDILRRAHAPALYTPLSMMIRENIL